MKRKPNIYFHCPFFPSKIILETHHIIKVQNPAVYLSKSHNLYIKLNESCHPGINCFAEAVKTKVIRLHEAAHGTTCLFLLGAMNCQISYGNTTGLL
jgi:hypothetical protein